mgnify:CR=1 FL=1|jgi:transposase-like protein
MRLIAEAPFFHFLQQLQSVHESPRPVRNSSDDGDVTCPHCHVDLAVTSEEARVGEESFQCNECQGGFVVNWDAERI